MKDGVSVSGVTARAVILVAYIILILGVIQQIDLLLLQESTHPGQTTFLFGLLAMCLGKLIRIEEKISRIEDRGVR